MSETGGPSSAPGERHGRKAIAGDLAAGLFLLLLAFLALWLTRNLPHGTWRSVGPGTLPQLLAIGVGLCGLVMIVATFIRPAARLQGWSLRGPSIVLLAIMAFAITIRPFSLGALSTPGLGLVVSGPLAILIGGFASAEARLKELVILSLSLTPFCMLLFGDALNLTIPIFSDAMAGLFPSGWTHKDILRATAAAMVLAAIAVWLAGRWARKPAAAKAPRQENI